MNPDVHPMSVAETIAAHGLERVAHFTPEKKSSPHCEASTNPSTRDTATELHRLR